jgi:hypothetical protein
VRLLPAALIRLKRALHEPCSPLETPKSLTKMQSRRSLAAATFKSTHAAEHAAELFLRACNPVC